MVDKRGDLVEHGEIGEHLFEDARTLHFDRDRAAVAQRGAMHLSERRRRERLFVEGEKRLRQAHVQVVFDRLLHIGQRNGIDVVLQAAQGLEIGRRQQVGARREDLTQLDERRAELFRDPSRGVPPPRIHFLSSRRRLWRSRPS